MKKTDAALILQDIPPAIEKHQPTLAMAMRMGAHALKDAEAREAGIAALLKALNVDSVKEGIAKYDGQD